MNEVALRANDVLRNDVMLRINDVALRANGFFSQDLKNTENCAIIKSERRWRYEKNFLFNIVVSIDDLYICNVYIL